MVHRACEDGDPPKDPEASPPPGGRALSCECHHPDASASSSSSSDAASDAPPSAEEDLGGGTARTRNGALTTTTTKERCGSEVCVSAQCARELREAERTTREAALRAEDVGLATSALVSLKRTPPPRSFATPTTPTPPYPFSSSSSSGPRAERGARTARGLAERDVQNGRRALVAKCADFTAALKREHPPGTPAFALFQKFVLAQRTAQGVADHKLIILDLVDLLKPTPALLKKFCHLLPRWCFTSAHAKHHKLLLLQGTTTTTTTTQRPHTQVFAAPQQRHGPAREKKTDAIVARRDDDDDDDKNGGETRRAARLTN